MSEIRDGQHRPAGPEEFQVPNCHFCGKRVCCGAFWMGHDSDLGICTKCMSKGRLGLLIGDGCETVDQIEHILLKTSAEAFRARLLADERLMLAQADEDEEEEEVEEELDGS